jgi:putative sigma-54 modulation protein
MNIHINGHNIKVSEELDQFVRGKLAKLDRYLPNISEIWVDLAYQETKRGANLAIAEVTLRHQRGAILRSEERLQVEDRDTIKSALNGAVDNMYKRIRRFKGRRKAQRGYDRYTMSAEELVLAEDTPDLTDAPVPGAETHDVVRRKVVDVVAMNEDEAIEQMELLGHSFFMFFNSDTEMINVLYKRSDDGYGILAPNVLNTPG